ncbi:MAG TPA: membrane protein insertion efficiency factor YidD [Candidatus Aquilonibacter sp.]|nr:membrane protein insertion efficiency factor YidD [Candidatus Aquilonibacter sp.]
MGAWILLVFVRLYVLFLSPILGGACKFYPSCSNYAYEAVARHGARKGAWLAAKRLLRCRPFTQGGFDPVPEVLYEEDALQEPSSAAANGAGLTPQSITHRPTQPVITETWSAAGTLGVERRL